MIRIHLLQNLIKDAMASTHNSDQTNTDSKEAIPMEEHKTVLVALRPKKQSIVAQHAAAAAAAVAAQSTTFLLQPTKPYQVLQYTHRRQ
jgi:hypothetical protein